MRISDIFRRDNTHELVTFLRQEYTEAWSKVDHTALNTSYPRAVLGSYPSGRQLLELPPQDKVRLISELVDAAVNRSSYSVEFYDEDIAAELMRGALPFQPKELAILIMRWRKRGWYGRLCNALLFQARQFTSDPFVRGELEQLYRSAAEYPVSNKEDRKQLSTIHELLFGAPLTSLTPEPKWLEGIRGLLGDEVAIYIASARGIEPKQKWLKGAAAFQINPLQLESASRQLVQELKSAKEPVLAEFTDHLRGFAWLIELQSVKGKEELLIEIAAAAGRKIDGSGPVAQKLFTSAVGSLGRIGSPEALAGLAKLRARVKAGQNLNLVVATLRAAAAREGVSLEELEELIVPTFDLEPPGRKRYEMPTGDLTMEITGSGAVELSFQRSDGKPQKNPPKDEIVSQAKKEAKAIREALVTQKDRLDRMIASERTLTAVIWQERYLNHPLMSALTRRLIWVIDGVPCGYLDGRMVDALDENVSCASEATIRLWHPIGSTVGTIKDWRDWVERHGITQPFKQAHRELYHPTSDELEGTETRRFAGHVLRQHAMSRVAKGRGYEYMLQGGFDNANNPRRWFSDELCLEWDVEPDWEREDQMTEAGISLYAITGAARFLGRDLKPVQISEINPLIFSEAMRDLDLLVAVSSATHDPIYRQREELDAPGALVETARTRADVLSRLLPRLGLKATIEGKYAHIKGLRASYKIHLGTGHAFVEPGSRFLAVEVGSDADVALPFEGDATLAKIVALVQLLSSDAFIADPFLREQIETI